MLFNETCIDLHQTGSVGEGSDHLQLIKFWLSHAPKKESVAGHFFWPFSSALLCTSQAFLGLNYSVEFFIKYFTKPEIDKIIIITNSKYAALL